MNEVKELLMMKMMQDVAQSLTPGKCTEHFAVTPESTQCAPSQQDEQEGTVLDSDATLKAELAQMRSAQKQIQSDQALLTKSIQELTALVSIISEKRTRNP